MSRVMVSIVIVNYNGKKFLKKCIDSILKGTKVPFEIILIDSGSKDGSVEYLKNNYKAEKRLIIIDSKKNLGPARSRNIGIKKAKGKYAAFLDCDTEVDKNWLSGAIKFLEENKNVGGGQLKILNMEKRQHFDCAGEKFTKQGFLVERARGAKDVGQFDGVEDIFSGKTAAMIFRKDVIRKAGGFDEDIFMYWEEPDLCWRVLKLGFRIVFLPMGKVWHAYLTGKKRVSEEYATWITYQGCRNQIITIFKNAASWDLPRMLFWVTGAWLILFILFLFKLKFKRVKAILRAFLWLIRNKKMLVKKRRDLKKRLGKFYSLDSKWFKKIEAKREISWYIGKGISYILGKPF